MRNNRGEKILRNLAKEVGLIVVDLRINGGQHVRAELLAPNGTILVTVFSSTPSDYRGTMNKRAELRRFFRQNQATDA